MESILLFDLVRHLLLVSRYLNYASFREFQVCQIFLRIRLPAEGALGQLFSAVPTKLVKTRGHHIHVGVKTDAALLVKVGARFPGLHVEFL